MGSERATVILWTIAALATASLGVRPEIRHRGVMLHSRTGSNVSVVCGLQVFETLGTQATFGDGRSAFFAGCQQKYSTDKCSFAVAELWQGRDLSSKMTVDMNSDFCQTLQLVVAASNRPALVDQSEAHASLEKAVSGKFWNGLFGGSSGTGFDEEESDEEDSDEEEEIDGLLRSRSESGSEWRQYWLTPRYETLAGATACSEGFYPPTSTSPACTGLLGSLPRLNEQYQCECAAMNILMQVAKTLNDGCRNDDCGETRVKTVRKRTRPPGCSLRGRTAIYNTYDGGDGSDPRSHLVCLKPMYRVDVDGEPMQEELTLEQTCKSIAVHGHGFMGTWGWPC